MPMDEDGQPADLIEHCPACDAAISVTREGTRIGAPRPVVEAAFAKLRVMVIDVRNGMVRANGSNIDRPEEGQRAGLEAMQIADVIVEVHLDNVFVRRGHELGIVSLMTTKTEAQMSLEKALREKDARLGGKQNDDLEKGSHPVTEKFTHVWDGSVESGKPVEGGLKGY